MLSYRKRLNEEFKGEELCRQIQQVKYRGWMSVREKTLIGHAFNDCGFPNSLGEF